MLEIELFDHLTFCIYKMSLQMLNWIVRNRTVWLFNCVYLQNVFANHIFNVYVKIGFGIKKPTMVEMP